MVTPNLKPWRCGCSPRLDLARRAEILNDGFVVAIMLEPRRARRTTRRDTLRGRDTTDRWRSPASSFSFPTGRRRTRCAFLCLLESSTSTRPLGVRMRRRDRFKIAVAQLLPGSRGASACPLSFRFYPTEQPPRGSSLPLPCGSMGEKRKETRAMELDRSTAGLGGLGPASTIAGTRTLICPVGPYCCRGPRAPNEIPRRRRLLFIHHGDLRNGARLSGLLVATG